MQMSKTRKTSGSGKPVSASCMKARTFLIILAAAAAVLLPSCTPNKRIMESVPPTPAAPVAPSSPAPPSIETDLQSMRNADFKFILVFRRRDGGEMDAEDKAFINANTPPDVNRRRLSEDGKAIIIGTNFPFLPGMIGNLTSRFVMEDHSKPDAGPLEIDRSANANTGKKPPANQ